MSKRAKRKPATSKRPKSKLGLPDLHHSKVAVLDSLRSPESKRGYRHAIDQFIQWYCSEPRLSFNKVVVARFSIFLESRGLAARIAVNPSIVADPSSLIVYQAGTPAGDSTRPDFILQQLTNASLTFSPNTGIGTVSAPFTGSLTTYLRQVISQQGEAASSADNLKQGQDVVLNSLQQRFNDVSGVNVDQEMANLLSLQNSYAANARVMSAVKDMLDALINM